MTKHHDQHHQTHYPQAEEAEVRTPYWRRAHHDWRFIAVVFVMLACVAVYVMSGDFAWTSHGRAAPILAPPGN